MPSDEGNHAPRAGTTSSLATLAIAQIAIGTAAVLARYALAAGMSPLALSVWRLTLAAGIVLLARVPVWRTSTPLPRIPPPIRKHLLAAGVLLAVHFATWFASLRSIPVATSTLLVCTVPVWTGLAEALNPARRPPLLFWVGLAIALPGALLVVTAAPPASTSVLAGPAWQGALLAVCGAISFAGYLLLTREAQTVLGTGRTVSWTYTTAALALWPVVAAASPSHATLPHGAVAWLPVVGMALFPQLVGHTLLNLSLRRLSASVVAAATLLEPVAAALLAWALLGERIIAAQGLGALLLLSGVALALIRRPQQSGQGTEAADMV